VERQGDDLILFDEMTPNKPVDPGVRVGHVHLKVANLERAVHFYCNVLGFDLTQRTGDSAAFISDGGYHHHIGLNTWESEGASPPAVDCRCSPNHLTSGNCLTRRTHLYEL
jgi:catechol-2,3-dioxygenase